MNKKSQVLIISLWILAILTVLAVGIGHRVAMSLRMSRYQKDSLKAFYLAKAGVNLAIAEIEKDTTAAYDSPDEKWANNEELFRNITLTDNALEYASVSYTFLDENNLPKTVYGAMDEERRININNAPSVLLASLLGESGVSVTSGVVNNILIWRGDAQDTSKVYESLGYPPKAADFTNTEELALVKDMVSDGPQEMRGLITVYGDKTNINTAPQEILKVIFHSQVEFLNSNNVNDVIAGDADTLAQKIIDCRRGGDGVEGTADDAFFSDISRVAAAIELNEKEEKILQQAIENGLIGVQSKFIRIEAAGHTGNVTKKLTVVYDRTAKNIVSRHEF